MPRGLTLLTPPAGEPLLLSDAKEWLRIPPADTSQDITLNRLLTTARKLIEDTFNRQLVTATWQSNHDRFPRYSSSAVWQYNSDAIWQQRLPVTQLSGQWYPDRASIRVTRPPMQQLLAITYVDGKGNPQTWSQVIPAGVPGSGVQTVTPATMVGIVPGLVVTVDLGAAQEQVTVSSVTATTFTATFASSHPANVQLNVVPGGLASLTGGSLITVDTTTEPGRIAPAYGQIWPIVRQQLASVQVTFTAGYGAAAVQGTPWTGPATAAMAILVQVADWFENREQPGELSKAAVRLCMDLWPGEYE